MIRTISRSDIGSRVFVYWNLHRSCFSIRSLATGRVIGHSAHVQLRNASGRVSEAGRQRVIAEGRKNVHAGIVGTLVGVDSVTPDTGVGEALTYNPYRYERFVFAADTSREFTGVAVTAWLHNRRVTVQGDATSGLY